MRFLRADNILLPTAAELTERLPRFFRRHRLMTSWMRLTGEDPVQLVRIRDNAFGYADMSDGFLRLIVIDKNYDKDFFIVADALLGNGGTFLDVGANFGLLSFGLAGKHEDGIDFHLFEPNSKLVDIVRRSKSLYPNMRCTLNQQAVSDKCGSLLFAINESQSGASHLAVGEESGIPVNSITLDAYIAEAKIERVNLLKLDIEGFELLALMGASNSLKERRIQAVYFEYFEKYLTRVGKPSAVFDLLESFGFVVCFCRDCDYGPRGGATHTISGGRPGHGLKLRPIKHHDVPSMTDLFALPKENLEVWA